MKEMERLHSGPIEPPTGDPYASEDTIRSIFAFRQQASAYLEAGVIDCDFPEFLENLNMYHDYLARIIKPGEALEELKKAPDNSVEYNTQTETLIGTFGKHFTEAAQLIRKSPQAMQLVQEAAQAGARLGGYAEEGPTGTSHAYTTIGAEHCDVYIPRAATDPIIAMKDFLFELTNFQNRARFIELEGPVRKNTITKDNFCSSQLKIEVDAMLKIGEIWSQMKEASKNPTKLGGYDLDFHLLLYQAHRLGRKSKDDLAKLAGSTKVKDNKTSRDMYGDYYDQLRNEQHLS